VGSARLSEVRKDEFPYCASAAIIASNASHSCRVGFLELSFPWKALYTPRIALRHSSIIFRGYSLAYTMTVSIVAFVPQGKRV
jgi:hypothetical protein